MNALKYLDNLREARAKQIRQKKYNRVASVTNVFNIPYQGDACFN